jgi:glycosyltransferase involved in cell wall biosynthesis
MAGLEDLPVTALVIGDGPGLPWLRERARVLGVSDRVLFTGRIPYVDVPRYLRLMDVALSTQTNNLPGQVRTTGKVPEYMAAGRFILASRVGEAELLLPGPMLVDYEGEVDRGYPARLAERIRTVFGSDELRGLGSTLPARARELCSYDVLSLEWSRLVEQLA